ncbi:hypothetical protein [uncultured Parabacteroides sp.]|uniref:hypothetical protein n=1 Tax=uncultured Parabacteroides sp. TaxID=512312 RepID=UPI0025DC817D|nr:hypothetical protein [uncultured Parabacteroides sp.]
MKQVIYIFSVMLLALFSCTDDILNSDQEKVIEGNKVQLNFQVNDIPDFKEITTKSADENTVEAISLMTFDKGGSFLGRVEAKVTQESGSGTTSGTGSALVPVETSTIHFIANYKWTDGAYVTPNGETESSLMSSLTSGTDNFYVAWGSVSNVDLSQTLSVGMLRNYAKVTVEAAKGSGFVVEGFALSQYADKGTVIAQEGTLNVANGYALVDHNATDCSNTNPKYLYEYENTYDRQTSVIVKRKDFNQYYKIQLLDPEGTPYPIERNYVYKVIINKIEEGAEGSSSFEEALKATPTNNIYVEVIKEATTVSDKVGNKLVVDPVYHLFVKDGTLTFKANYYPNGGSATNNEQISVKLIHNGHQTTSILPDITEETTLPVGTGGVVTTRVAHPGGDLTNLALDSAMLRVNAGVLTRIVTVFISKQYDFHPQSANYTENSVGQQIPLKFTIPSDFPETLLPIKCYIKADGLNPVKTDGQEDMLVEHKDGTIYYVYEAKSTGDKTLMFKTIQTVVDNPTITNEYFADGAFIMRLEGKKVFSNISAGPAYYESGSTFTLKFNMESDATVTISGNGINTVTHNGRAGENTVTLTTSQHGAAGTINLKAEGYNDGSIDYSNNYQLSTDQIVTGNLDCGYYGILWWNEETVSSGTIATGNANAIATIDSQNHYTMTLNAGISVNDNIEFTVNANGKTYTSRSVPVSNFFGNNTTMKCKR